MHTSVQPSGRSPRPVNGPTSTSQLKPGSDSIQNSMNSFPSQVKGKKRERPDQGSDSSKRERFSKTDDIDSAHQRTESMLKCEISKITEKGGLVDSEGVEKLVHLMKPEKAEKKIDLISRSMIAYTLAATEKIECLHQFVQLRGLPVLDEWLQDIHKGKFGGGNTTKDNDRSVEDFLLVLLRALDKLPVNIQALQMCNIGRSVNHLRTHKNVDIQKKARSLVDIWKKRVEAEMNSIDAKSGGNQGVSLPSKSRLPEASLGANKINGGSSDFTTKSMISHLSVSRAASAKVSQDETTAKSVSSSHGLAKSMSPASSKEGRLRSPAGGASDIIVTREDKSSSSSHSQNQSPSLSGKEDARSSTAGSMSVNKLSGGSSRHRRSTNGFLGALVPVGQKDAVSGRSSSLNKNSQSGLNGERALDSPVLEGSSHKLIVKIPSKVRSPGTCASGGSFEDPAIMSSQASSPLLSEKQDQSDQNPKEMNDALQSTVASDVNTESWQSSDFKDVLSGSDESDEERSKAIEDARKSAEVSKDASSSSGNELKPSKTHEASFSSMNALIESCVKYSEANTSMSLNDAVGMNLLASVATEEMSKSGLVSPSNSPKRFSHTGGEACTCSNSKSKPSAEGNLGASRGNSREYGVNEIPIADAVPSENGLHSFEHASLELSGERKCVSSPSGDILTGEYIKQTSPTDLQASDPCSETNDKSGVLNIPAACSPVCTLEKAGDGEPSKQTQEERLGLSSMRTDGAKDIKLEGNVLLNDEKVNRGLISGPDTNQTSTASFEDGYENPDVMHKSNHADQKPLATMMNQASVENDKNVQQPDFVHNNQIHGKVVESKVDSVNINDRGAVNQSEGKTSNQEANGSLPIKDQALAEMAAEVTGQKKETTENAVEDKVLSNLSGESRPQSESPAIITTQESEKQLKLIAVKLPEAEVKKSDESSIMAEVSSSSAVRVPEMAPKMKFDLNEGFIADEGRCVEPIAVTRYLPTLHMLNPLHHSSMSSTLPASVTVAAAAKGPFVPPEDLLKGKGEVGWKGSAATSAFRPAEPRKLEIPLNSMNVSNSGASANKNKRAPLDFDLNMPDETLVEEMTSRDSGSDICSTSDVTRNRSQNDLSGAAQTRSSAGLDLDLNRTDETIDMGQCFASSSHRQEDATTLVKPSAAHGRDFDLNDGPSSDDAIAEQPSFIQNVRVSLQSQPPVVSLRMNNPDIGSFSSWFTPGGTYSTVTMPSILPERGEQPFPILPPGAPQRMMGPPAGGTPFTPDVYRGSVLSSSPAVPFPSSPFPYPVFPFGTSFPLPSVTFPVGSSSYMDPSSGGRIFTSPMNSQLLGPVPAVTHQYPRPYMVSLPEGITNSCMENSRKWSRQGLDLNAGPGVLDPEGREEQLPSVSRQLSIASSQALVDEQMRMYTIAGGVSKRKEPEGGWNSDSLRYKQPSWQ